MFDVTQTQSKLWRPLHIRQRRTASKNTTQIASPTVCTPEQTCDIYANVLQCINKDNERIKQLIENIECEQQCLKELLHDETHWMGSVNGTQRKLMHCGMNLDIMIKSLQDSTQDGLTTIPESGIDFKKIKNRKRGISIGSSNNSSNTVTNSTSGDKKNEVIYNFYISFHASKLRITARAFIFVLKKTKYLVFKFKVIFVKTRRFGRCCHFTNNNLCG